MVEALKGLVDEFAQFARMRGPRLVPTDLNALIDGALLLYAAVLQQGRLVVQRKLAPTLPPVPVDAEQMRQVVINLVDNDFLDNRPGNFGYAVFGRVVGGIDVIDRIAKVKTGRRRGHDDVPAETVLVNTARRTGAA